MSVETGIVVTDGRKAIVKFKRTSACGRCGKCQHGVEEMDGFMLLDAVNRAGARTGDTVRVSVPASDALAAAAYLYLLPWALGVIGLVLGAMFAPAWGWAAETGGIAGGGVFLVLAYILIWRLDGRARRSGRFQPVVTAVVRPRLPAVKN